MHYKPNTVNCSMIDCNHDNDKPLNNTIQNNNINSTVLSDTVVDGTTNIKLSVSIGIETEKINQNSTC
jgi:hypothetical protein